MLTRLLLLARERDEARPLTGGRAERDARRLDHGMRLVGGLHVAPAGRARTRNADMQNGSEFFFS